MKIINNYNDFIVDIILEKIKNKELKLYITPKLKKILFRIDHDIARALIHNHESGEGEFKITVLDIDDDEKNFDKFIVSQSNKVYDEYNRLINLSKNTTGVDYPIDSINKYLYDRVIPNEIMSKNRLPMRIGSLVGRLYGDRFPNAGKSDNSVTKFVELVVGQRTKESGLFNIVKGDDIIKYYNESNYEKVSGTLGGSCMRYRECSKFMEFYAKNDNKINMLVLLSPDDPNKIIGRALIWYLDQPENKIFMDRIYTIYPSDVDKFKNYAKNNGWLYKTRQDASYDAEIHDTVTEQSSRIILGVDGLKTSSSYPYIDTLKFFNISNNSLTNDKNSNYDYLMESTRGGYYKNRTEFIYDERTDSIIDEDDRPG